MAAATGETVAAGGTTLHHVSTAAELPMLLDQLAAQTPARLAVLHGLPADTFAPTVTMAADEALRALRGLAPVLERVPAEPRTAASGERR